MSKKIIKEEYEFLREATYSVANVDQAVSTIAACIQLILDKKNMNPTMCGELISMGLTSGLDSVGAVQPDMPNLAAMKKSKEIGKRVNKELVGYLRSL